MHSQYFRKPITKRFIDAFPKFKREEGDTSNYFLETWLASPFYDSSITENELKEIYYHLLATYYNWHYVYLDDFGIALNTMHVIHEYYPNTRERLALVKQLREMTLDEFKKSGAVIDSQASNPKVSTQMDELVDLIDSQTASFQLKSDEQSIRGKFNSLYDGVMDAFIDRFKDHFTKIYSGLNNYIYENEREDEE